MRAKLLFLLLPLLLLAQAQAGDPGGKWRISVGWSYFLSWGGRTPRLYYHGDSYLNKQKGPNNWFFPSLGFEYRFSPKWNVTVSVTPHPYMLITKYQIGRDVLSWKEGEYALGIALGPTLSWSARSDEGFNYQFHKYGNINYNDHNLEPASGFWGAIGGIYIENSSFVRLLRFSVMAWFSQSVISQYGKPDYASNFFYYGFTNNYYNNPVNDFFIADKSVSECTTCGGYKLKTVYFQGVLLGITLLL